MSAPSSSEKENIHLVNFLNASLRLSVGLDEIEDDDNGSISFSLGITKLDEPIREKVFQAIRTTCSTTCQDDESQCHPGQSTECSLSDCGFHAGVIACSGTSFLRQADFAWCAT